MGAEGDSAFALAQACCRGGRHAAAKMNSFPKLLASLLLKGFLFPEPPVATSDNCPFLVHCIMFLGRSRTYTSLTGTLESCLEQDLCHTV